MKMSVLYSRTLLLALALTTLSVSACTKKEDPDSTASAVGATTSATVPVTEPEPTEPVGKCAALGCTGTGDFSSMCNCKDKPQEVPFEAKPTGKYHSFFKKPEWELTNKTDKDISWASAAVYYYDKSGKQLEATTNGKSYKLARINGSTFTLKPKETKTISFGFLRDAAPAGAASMVLSLPS